MEQNLRILEAILFATPEPLSPAALRTRLPEGMDIDLGAGLRDLQEIYAGHGIHLVERDGSWAFRTAHDLESSLHALREVKRKISRVAMETLAIIAYHQPVTRAEIENIRGVATSKGTLDILMEAGWIKLGRRKDVPGRPLTWVTTTGFLDHFGLSSLRDLPGLGDLKTSGLLDTRPAIETLRIQEEFDLKDPLDDEKQDSQEPEDVHTNVHVHPHPHQNSHDSDNDMEREAL